MSDDDLARQIHRAAGDPPATPDLAAVRRRGGRRRTARIVTSSMAAAVVLVGAGLAVTARPARHEVQLGSTDRPATPPAADVRPAGAVRTLPPQAEGEVVATAEGFVLVSGAVPAQVWSSVDGRWWVRQRARGLESGLLVDVATTSEGAVVALESTGVLWTSPDLGASWRRVALPDGVERVTRVGGDDRWWYLAGTSGRQVRLLAVPRAAADRVRTVDGDLTVRRLRGDRPAAMVAAGAAGTVLVAVGRPRPTVWLVADDLTTTRVDGAFGHASVTGVTATADGFAATVLPEGAARPELWRSADGRTWKTAVGGIPAPTCAQVVESGGAAVASGSPCGQDAGWEIWRRTGGRWVGIGKEIEDRPDP